MKNKCIKSILGLAIIFLLLTLVFFPIVFTQNANPILIEVSDTMIRYNQCTPKKTVVNALDHNGRLDVTVWNIYKENRSDVFNDLLRMSKDNNLMLLQEVLLKPQMQQYIKAQGLHADMASAFKIFDVPSGVMNLSRSPAISSCDYLTKEPWLRLPKSALISHFPLSNGQTLLVLNLHAINFSWRLTAFNAQLQVLAQQLKQHQGPILMGGDFNTWREARLQQVKNMVQALGLQEALYTSDRRRTFLGYHLDHLYYRDLNFISAQSLPLTSSDHNPIQANFQLQ